MAPGSPADCAGIRQGGSLIQINGHPIRDALDYQFYSTDEILDCLFLQNGRKVRVRFDRRSGENPGLELEPMEFNSCGNRCLFCFSDQNPKGMRETLYFKDEDYRLSFLFGNYVTLTRVNGADLVRIAEQRLSPLFVSVHAFDPAVRSKLLGIGKNDGLWDKLQFLAENKITLHGQIVLCPGINDNEILDATVTACVELYPAFHSLSVVPVGLTGHRRGLFQLKSICPATAKTVVSQIRKIQTGFRKKLGESFVHLSDEFYILSGEPFPAARHYGGFWQSDNGVGMTVQFLETFRESAESFPKRLREPLSAVLLTGTLAGPILKKHVLPALKRIRNLDVDVIAVPNRFYGESVTVSGLLTGRDMARALESAPKDAAAWLPPNCVNADGLFLDGWTAEDLSKKTNRKIIIMEDFADAWETP